MYLLAQCVLTKKPATIENMKILIFGASGSGTTTLGENLAGKLGYALLDADDYYWEKTDPPFQDKVPLAQRNQALTADFERFENVIVSGSLVSWGEHWKTAFDLAIFLYLPKAVRMARLESRESERYGGRLAADPTTALKVKAFLDWAARYDDEGFKGRSRTMHLHWMKTLTCPVLRIEGPITLAERLHLAEQEIKAIARRP